jgi:hypothetical protein
MLGVALYSGFVVLREIDAVQADAADCPLGCQRATHDACASTRARALDAADDAQHRRRALLLYWEARE